MRPSLDQQPMFVAMVMVLLFGSLFLEGCNYQTPGARVIELMHQCSDDGYAPACEELSRAL